MKIDLTYPKNLYRYSEKKWLERSLLLGEFRLRPASDYKQQETDLARHDDELIRTTVSSGEFVSITSIETGKRIKPVGDVVYQSHVGTDYFTTCFSRSWDISLFDEFPGTDACLVIHEPEKFSERFHLAVEKILPNWAGIDAAVTYGGKNKLGAVFSKPLKFMYQDEWRFAWHPGKLISKLTPIVVSIGCISDITSVVDRNQTKIL